MRLIDFRPGRVHAADCHVGIDVLQAGFTVPAGPDSYFLRTTGDPPLRRPGFPGASWLGKTEEWADPHTSVTVPPC